MNSRDFKGRPFYINDAYEPKAQVLILHGICEHGLRYSDLSHFLKKNRFSSAFTDHPGHGLFCPSGPEMQAVTDSYSNNDDFNRLSASFLHYRNTETSHKFLQECNIIGSRLNLREIADYQIDFLNFLYQENIFRRDLPLIIFGQSLGGLICSMVTHKLKDRDIRPEGVILYSPAFGPVIRPPRGKGLFYKAAGKAETFFLNKSKKACQKNTLFKLMVLNPLLKLNPSRGSEWSVKYISDLEEENHLFDCDPLIHRKLSMHFLFSILQSMVENVNKAAKFPCPFFTAYGTDDRIVDSRATDVFVENYLKSNIGNKTTIKRVENFMPHELHKSSMKSEVFTETAEWINMLIDRKPQDG